MQDIFFQKIPSILFEPIAVCAALGLVTAAICLWKRRSAMYWVVAFSLIFMLGWRVIIQISSSRYASILVFPATIGTAYFAFKLESLSGYIPKFPVLLRKYLPYLAVLGIVIGGIGQLLHYNPYADRVLKIAALIKKDATKYNNCHILASDIRRMKYYTDLPVSAISNSDLSETEYFKRLAFMLEKGPVQPAEILYIVVPTPCMSDWQKNVPGFIQKELVLLGEFYHNRKRKRVTRVYRYNIRKAFQMQVSESDKTAVNGRLLYNFTFNKFYPDGHQFYARQRDYFMTRQDHLQTPVLKNFPVGWEAYWCGGFPHGSNGELGLVKQEDGRVYFRLKGDAVISSASSKLFEAQPYRMKVILRGVPGSVWTIGMHFYDKQWMAFKTAPNVQIDNAHLFSFVYTLPEIPDKARKMRLGIHVLQGEIDIHSIDLYAVPDEGTHVCL